MIPVKASFSQNLRVWFRRIRYWFWKKSIICQILIIIFSKSLSRTPIDGLAISNISVSSFQKRFKKKIAHSNLFQFRRECFDFKTLCKYDDMHEKTSCSTVLASENQHLWIWKSGMSQAEANLTDNFECTCTEIFCCLLACYLLNTFLVSCSPEIRMKSLFSEQ